MPGPPIESAGNRPGDLAGVDSARTLGAGSEEVTAGLVERSAILALAPGETAGAVGPPPFAKVATKRKTAITRPNRPTVPLKARRVQRLTCMAQPFIRHFPYDFLLTTTVSSIFDSTSFLGRKVSANHQVDYCLVRIPGRKWQVASRPDVDLPLDKLNAMLLILIFTPILVRSSPIRHDTCGGSSRRPRGRSSPSWRRRPTRSSS